MEALKLHQAGAELPLVPSIICCMHQRLELALKLNWTWKENWLESPNLEEYVSLLLPHLISEEKDGEEEAERVEGVHFCFCVLFSSQLLSLFE